MGKAERRAVMRIVFGYAVIASAWILFSDTLLSQWVSDPAVGQVLQSFKGLLFVVITAGLLAGLLIQELRGRLSAVAALDQRLRFAAQIVEALPGVVYVHDLTQQTSQCVNHGLGNVLGYDAEHIQALGARFLRELSHPEDWPRQFQSLVEHRAPLPPAEAPPALYRLRHADGGWRWLRHYTLVFTATAEGRPRQILGVAFDVTPEHQTEETVRNNERRFRALTEASPVGLFQTDAQGECIYANERWSEITGLPEAQALGLGWTAALPDDNRAAVLERWLTAAHSNQTVELTYQVQRPDGRRAWVLGRAQPIHLAGVFQGHVGTLTDISAHKAAEARSERLAQLYALLTDVNQTLMRARERQPLFKAVCKNAVARAGLRLAWIGLVDATGRMAVACSAGAAGAYLEQLQRQLTDNPRGAHPAAVAIREARALYPDLKPASAGLPGRAEALALGHTALAVLPLLTFGQVRGVLGLHTAEPDFLGPEEQRLLEVLARDISLALELLEQEAQRQHAEITLRQSEARFRAFFEQAPWYCFMVTPDGTLILDVNATALEGLGYTRAELVGTPILHLYTPAARGQAEAAWERWRTTGSPGQPELVLRTRAGAERIVGLNIETIHDPAGQPLYAIVIQRDLSDSVQAEAARRESEARYRQLVEQAPIAIIICQAGQIVFANPAAARLLGAAQPEALVGRPAQAFVEPADWPAAAARLDALTAGGPALENSVNRYRRLDGEAIDVQIHAAPLIHQGQPAVQVLAQDVTARRRAEAELRRSTERLRNLHEIDHAIIQATSPADIVAAALARLRRLIPCERATMHLIDAASGLAEVFAVMGASDIQSGRPWALSAATLARLLSGEPALIADMHALDNPSPNLVVLRQERFRSYLVIPLVVRGSLLGSLELGALTPNAFTPEHLEIAAEVGAQLAVVFGNARLLETTLRQSAELRASESRYRHLVEHLPAIVYRFSDRRGGVYYSPHSEALLGWSPDELYAQPMLWHDAIDPAARPRIDAAIQAFQAGGAFDLEYRIRGRDGRWRWLRDLSIARVTEGDETFIEGLAVDITARKQAEDALQTQFTMLNALYAQAHQFTESLDPLQVADSVTRQCVETFGAQLAWLGEAAPDGHVEILAHFPLGVDYPRQGRVRWDDSPEGQGPTGRAIRERAPVLAQAVAPAAGDTWRDLLQRSSLQASAAFPLISRERALGALNLYSSQAGFFSAELIALFQAFAHQAAAALANARLYQAAAEHSEQLRGLAARLAEVEEAERRALARELHDRVGANLTALNLSLTLVSQQLSAEAKPRLAPRLEDAGHLLQETMAQVRDVMMDLRPSVLDDYGLLAALRWYTARLAQRTELQVTVAGAEPAPRLAPTVETTLFRIAQEALTNVVKHAHARQAQVRLETAGPRVRLTILDDGIGLEPGVGGAERGAAGWGMIHMRERAEALGGQLRVDTAPSRGTHIHVELTR